MMTDEKLNQTISAGDVDAARVAIRAIADADIRREKPIAVSCADEANAAFAAQGKALYESDDGRFVMPPQSEWTKSLLYKIKGSLDWNFSRERLVRLQEVTVWLHNKERESSASFQNARTEQSQASAPSASELNKWVKYAIVGVAAALALGVVAFRLLTRNH